MATRNSTCAQVAKLVRAVFKESFPNIECDVHAYTYPFGAWVLIAWTDGPTERQVEPIAAAFTGLRRDAEGNLHRCVDVTFDGVPMKCRLGRVIKHRGYSQPFVERALVAVYTKYLQAFHLHQIAEPTYAQYEAGQLWQHKFASESEHRFVSVHELVNAELDGQSGIEQQVSATLARIGCTDAT